MTKSYWKFLICYILCKTLHIINKIEIESIINDYVSKTFKIANITITLLMSSEIFAHI